MAEMLSIFDEAAPSTGAFPLLVDGFVSLTRQWVLRSGSWKLAAALLGAFLQFIVGGLIWVAMVPVGRTHENASIPDFQALQGLMRLTVVSVGGIVSMVATASLWIGIVVRKRSG